MSFIATSIQQRDIRAIEIEEEGERKLSSSIMRHFGTFQWTAPLLLTMGYLLVIFSSFKEHLRLKSFHEIWDAHISLRWINSISSHECFVVCSFYSWWNLKKSSWFNLICLGKLFTSNTGDFPHFFRREFLRTF
jgi:hypothetical protein